MAENKLKELHTITVTAEQLFVIEIAVGQASRIADRDYVRFREIAEKMELPEHNLTWEDVAESDEPV